MKEVDPLVNLPCVRLSFPKILWYMNMFPSREEFWHGKMDRQGLAVCCERFFRVHARYPQLYAYGIKDRCMRPMIFWSWMLQASERLPQKT